ncbi:hypothetical protein MD484_g6667, partial [Candolleomyces efflorescens]
MGNRRHIPESVKEQLVVMSAWMKPSAVAKVTGISKVTVNRVLKLSRETGSVVRVPLQNGRPRTLNSLHVAYLESLIERTPDLYLTELQEELEVSFDIRVSEWIVAETLRRRGFTRKQVSRAALERNEELREEYQILIAENYRPDQLVFVGESACNRNTTKRKFAWSIGTRARRHDYFIRGQRYSILPALSLDGILHLDVIPRSYTAELFNGFIEGLLDTMNPFPAPNSVIVMDNASIHKSEALRQMVEARGMRLVFLPAYSPDFNPIEEAFSAIKAWIRANRDYVRGELAGEITCDPFSMIWSAVFESVTLDKVQGWFHDCGYL